MIEQIFVSLCRLRSFQRSRTHCNLWISSSNKSTPPLSCATESSLHPTSPLSRISRPSSSLRPLPDLASASVCIIAGGMIERGRLRFAGNELTDGTSLSWVNRGDVVKEIPRNIESRILTSLGNLFVLSSNVQQTLFRSEDTLNNSIASG